MHDGAFTSLAAAIRHHLDPAASLLAYDTTSQGLAPDLAGPTGPRLPLLGSLDTRLATPIQLTPTEFDDLVAFVLELYRQEAAPKTIRNYQSDLACFARWLTDTPGEAFAATFGIPAQNVFTDYKAMLSDIPLDVVSICTWPHLHAPMVVDCAGATVKAIQAKRGSRAHFAKAEAQGGWRTAITADLAGFLTEVRSFYFATASADGQPYIQHRGGPPGFLRVSARLPATRSPPRPYPRLHPRHDPAPRPTSWRQLGTAPSRRLRAPKSARPR